MTPLEIRIRLKFYLQMLEKNFCELIIAVDDYKKPEIYQRLWSLSANNELDDYIVNVSRLLVNFISLACAVKDNCRLMIREHYAKLPFYQDYKDKVKDLFEENGLTSFVEEFRNFALHYQIPLLNAKGLSFPISSYEDLGFVFSKNKLNDFIVSSSNKKTKLAKSFLDGQDRDIDVKNIIEKYFDIISYFYEWLFSSIPEIGDSENS